jgi:hypothetical protein
LFAPLKIQMALMGVHNFSTPMEKPMEKSLKAIILWPLDLAEPGKMAFKLDILPL